MHKIVRADNPRLTMWNKVKKSSKIGQEQKTLTFAFAQFLIAFTTVLYLQEKLGTRIYLQPIFTFS